MSVNTEYARPILASCFRRSLNPGQDLVEGIISLKIADLSGMELTSMQGLDMCGQLETVDLSANYLRRVDGSVLELLPLLRSLNLARNKIGSPEALEGLAGLPEEVRLQHVNLALNPVRFDLSAPLPLPRSLAVLTLDSRQVAAAGGKDALEAKCRAQFPGFQGLSVVEVLGESGDASPSQDGAGRAEEPLSQLPTPEEGIALRIAREAALPPGYDSLQARFDKDHNPVGLADPGAPGRQQPRSGGRAGPRDAGRPGQKPSSAAGGGRGSRVDDGSGPTQPRSARGAMRPGTRPGVSSPPPGPRKAEPTPRSAKRPAVAAHPPQALPSLAAASGSGESASLSRREERSAELQKAMEESRRKAEQAALELKELDSIFAEVKSEIDAKIEESSRREVEAYTRAQKL